MSEAQTSTAQSVIATLFAANPGRIVTATPKGEDVPKKYRMHKLAEKIGTMKSGEKAEYVIFASMNDDGTTNDATVVSLHPNVVKELFEKGVSSGYTLEPIEGAENLSENDQLEVELQAEAKAELEAEQAAGGTTDGQATDATTTTAAPATKKTKADKQAEKAAAKEKREADRKAEKEKKEAAKKAEKEQKEAAAGPTKKDRAVAIYKSEPDGENKRKNVIAKFKADEKDGGLGMGAAGANTYYQNCKSGLWS